MLTILRRKSFPPSQKTRMDRLLAKAVFSEIDTDEIADSTLLSTHINLLRNDPIDLGEIITLDHLLVILGHWASLILKRLNTIKLNTDTDALQKRRDSRDLLSEDLLPFFPGYLQAGNPDKKRRKDANGLANANVHDEQLRRRCHQPCFKLASLPETQK